MLFEAFWTHLTTTAWMKEMRPPVFNSEGPGIMDNDLSHSKSRITTVLNDYGHGLLPRPGIQPNRKGIHDPKMTEKGFRKALR